jgi:hypothetical protein
VSQLLLLSILIFQADNIMNDSNAASLEEESETQKSITEPKDAEETTDENNKKEATT